MSHRLRTVFMGTPEIAVPALRVLAAETDCSLVVTQPDRPAGRGRRVHEPAVKQAAKELNIPVWQPETLKGASKDPRLADLDLIVVMAYGALLRQKVLDLPRGGCINLHASLLPRWRGASPLQAAIRAGDEQTGVCVMHMVRALDAGGVYVEEVVPMNAETTLPILHDQLADAAALGLQRFLQAYPDIEAKPQDDAAATWCHKLTSADGRLDFQQSALALDRQVRAYTPAPGCWVMADGKRFGVSKVRIGTESLPPGEVRVVDGSLAVGCADACLLIDEFKPPGKRAMPVRDWLNGHQAPAAFE